MRILSKKEYTESHDGAVTMRSCNNVRVLERGYSTERNHLALFFRHFSSKTNFVKLIKKHSRMFTPCREIRSLPISLYQTLYEV